MRNRRIDVGSKPLSVLIALRLSVQFLPKRLGVFHTGGIKSSCILHENVFIKNPYSSARWNLRPIPHPGIAHQVQPTGDVLRVYRLAVAATAQYTQFQGGTKEKALAAITTTINRVTGVYERGLSIRMKLIDKELDTIYTDPANQPYTNVMITSTLTSM